MDFKKLLGDTQKKVNEFLEKDSTKEKVKMIREKSVMLKDKFDDVCDQADVKIKSYLDKNKNSEEPKAEAPKAEAPKAEDLSSLKLSSKVEKTLNEAGINTVEDIKNKDIEEIAKIKGIGKATLEKIEKIKKSL